MIRLWRWATGPFVRSIRRAPTIMVIVALIMGGVLVGAAVNLYHVRQADWEPIGPFPRQEVLSVDADTILVEGTKCYDDRVAITGEVRLISVDPPGLASLLMFRGGREVEPGCYTRTFANQWPPGALALIEEWDTEIVWMLWGEERPRDPDDLARVGAPATWETDHFIYQE